MNKLIKVINDSGLDESKTQVLISKFNGYLDIASEWEVKAKQIVVADEDDEVTMKLAREGRKFMKQKRVDVENTRKSLKEQSLREGQAIDAVARFLKGLIEPIETYLESQEKYKEIKEGERRQARRLDRVKILTELEFDYTFTDLLNMDDSSFDALVSRIKEEIVARREVERKEEEARIEREKADAEERERIRIENERLKEEIAEREWQMVLQKAEKDRIEKELANKRAAELKEQEDRASKERAVAMASDKDKLRMIADMVLDIKLPEVSSVEAQAVCDDVRILFLKIRNFVLGKVDAM